MIEKLIKVLDENVNRILHSAYIDDYKLYPLNDTKLKFINYQNVKGYYAVEDNGKILIIVNTKEYKKYTLSYDDNGILIHLKYGDIDLYFNY